MSFFCIDPDNGNDSTASGQATQAEAELTPYKTWAAAKSAGLTVNDNVFLQKRGTIALEAIGGVFRRIRFGAYGDSDLPIPIMDGNNTLSTCITAASNSVTHSPVIVEDLEIRNFTANGVVITGGTTQQALQVRRCYIHSVGNIGIAFGADGSIIEDNVVENTGNSNIQAISSAGIPTINAFVQRNVCTNAITNDNIAIHNATGGSDNILVSSNTCTTAAEECIDVIQNSTNIIVELNTCSDSRIWGIANKGGVGNIIRHNTVFDCDNSAFAAKNTGASEVYGNIFKNSGKVSTAPLVRLGDLAGESVDVVFLNNTIIGETGTTNLPLLQVDDLAVGPITIKNNVIVVEDPTKLAIRDSNTTAATIVIDANIVQSDNSTPYNKGGTLRTLAEWQALDGYDINGQQVTDAKLVGDDYYPAPDSPVWYAGAWTGKYLKDHGGRPFKTPNCAIGAWEQSSRDPKTSRTFTIQNNPIGAWDPIEVDGGAPRWRLNRFNP